MNLLLFIFNSFIYYDSSLLIRLNPIPAPNTDNTMIKLCNGSTNSMENASAANLTPINPSIKPTA